MSYARSFTRQISITGSVSYPASQSGGVKSVTLTDTLEVEVTVDTAEFDEGVAQFTGSVAGLQEAIGGAAIAQQSEKLRDGALVAETARKGFQTTIAQGLGQQMIELRSLIASKLQLLRQSGEAMQSIRAQFIGDFNRIKARYFDLFNALDEELKRRIQSLNEEPVRLVNTAYRQGIRAQCLRLPAQTVCLSGETSEAAARLQAAHLTKNLKDGLEGMKAYVDERRRFSDGIGVLLHDRRSVNGESATISIPALFAEVDDPDKGSGRVLVNNIAGDPAPGVSSAHGSMPFDRDLLAQGVLRASSTRAGDSVRPDLESAFMRRLQSARQAGSDEMSRRIAAAVAVMWADFSATRQSDPR